jgi:hypothetical protein
VEGHQSFKTPAGENVCENPKELPEGLGSLGDPCGNTEGVTHDVALGPQPDVTTEQQVSLTSLQVPMSDPIDDLKQMLAGIMAVVQQSNAKLQESQEQNKKFQERVQAKLQENQEKAENFQASVKADISSVMADLKAENEKLMKQLDLKSSGDQREEERGAVRHSQPMFSS